MTSVRRAYFVSRSCILVKGDGVEEDHEPVMIDHASDSNCNSDTETSRRQRACEIKCT